MAPSNERFEQLVREHSLAVVSYLRRRIAPMDASEVDDLLTETMMVVWRRIGEVPEGAELAWTLGVARRVLANAQRSTRRRSKRVRVLVLNQPSSEDVVAAQAALAQGLAVLSDDEREILLASVWDGLSINELALVYEISDNAATLRLSRARAKFLEAFHEEGLAA